MMTIDLENELRQAYAQLPDDHADPTETIARSRRGATRIRRRRTAGACAGTVAAALAVGAVASFGPGVGTSEHTVRLMPAAAPSATATPSTAPAPPTPKKLKLPQEGTDKPLAGVSGKLLPHGKQLPNGLLYHGVNTQDYEKTWTKSLADGGHHSMPVPTLIGADQTAGSPTPSETDAAYGMVSDVFDLAENGLADTDPDFRYLSSTIVRFRSPASAQSAIAKAQRGEAGLYWVWKKVTTPNVAWSGVPGVTGDHGVYDLRSPGPNPGFVVYQVVGSYIVTASSETKATAEQGVTDMVANLKTAGLLK